MRKKYEKQLENLKNDVFKLGEMCGRAVEDSILSLKSQNVELAKEVIKNDDVIDDLYRNLEERCLEIIALQQPVAHDLRILITTVKVLTDLERIGDYANNIAEITVKLKDSPYFKPLINIANMAELGRKMLKMSMHIYMEERDENADEVFELDNEVDSTYHQLFRELTSYMMEDPKTITQASQFMLVARHLERIADHALNIANRVIYMVRADIEYI
ncbi:MAG: phosphate signaling complex protein PhoU [Candidatus Methanofastidiosia archaeon]